MAKVKLVALTDLDLGSGVHVKEREPFEVEEDVAKRLVKFKHAEEPSAQKAKPSKKK